MVRVRACSCRCIGVCIYIPHAHTCTCKQACACVMYSSTSATKLIQYMVITGNSASAASKHSEEMLPRLRDLIRVVRM